MHQDVLVDNELGEAMTTEVFESEPPLPPRPWTKVRGPEIRMCQQKCKVQATTI